MPDTPFGWVGGSGGGEIGPRGFPGVGISDITYTDLPNGTYIVNIHTTDGKSYQHTGTILADTLEFHKLILSGNNDVEKMVIKLQNNNNFFIVDTQNEKITANGVFEVKQEGKAFLVENSSGDHSLLYDSGGSRLRLMNNDAGGCVMDFLVAANFTSIISNKNLEMTAPVIDFISDNCKAKNNLNSNEILFDSINSQIMISKDSSLCEYKLSNNKLEMALLSIGKGAGGLKIEDTGGAFVKNMVLSTEGIQEINLHSSGLVKIESTGNNVEIDSAQDVVIKSNLKVLDAGNTNAVFTVDKSFSGIPSHVNIRGFLEIQEVAGQSQAGLIITGESTTIDKTIGLVNQVAGNPAGDYITINKPTYENGRLIFQGGDNTSIGAEDILTLQRHTSDDSKRFVCPGVDNHFSLGIPSSKWKEVHTGKIFANLSNDDGSLKSYVSVDNSTGELYKNELVNFSGYLSEPFSVITVLNTSTFSPVNFSSYTLNVVLNSDFTITSPKILQYTGTHTKYVNITINTTWQSTSNNQTITAAIIESAASPVSWKPILQTRATYTTFSNSCIINVQSSGIIQMKPNNLYSIGFLSVSGATSLTLTGKNIHINEL